MPQPLANQRASGTDDRIADRRRLAGEIWPVRCGAQEATWRDQSSRLWPMSCALSNWPAGHAALVLLRWRDAEPQVAERDDESDRVGWNVAFTMMVPTAFGAMCQVAALNPLPPITF